ncbi:hypothetical protein BU15DRAFT_63782 [Melanogaster broomeanus]|nr:hypothetical protein BU15DRAFT_63782 [Melanogaster broomeanus]
MDSYKPFIPLLLKSFPNVWHLAYVPERLKRRRTYCSVQRNIGSHLLISPIELEPSSLGWARRIFTAKLEYRPSFDDSPEATGRFVSIHSEIRTDEYQGRACACGAHDCPSTHIKRLLEILEPVVRAGLEKLMVEMVHSALKVQSNVWNRLGGSPSTTLNARLRTWTLEDTSNCHLLTQARGEHWQLPRNISLLLGHLDSESLRIHALSVGVKIRTLDRLVILVTHTHR